LKLAIAGSGLKDFSQYKRHVNMVSLLWPLPTPEDHDLKKPEFTLYQKALCKYELFWFCGS
jgi:hypothetical protein